MIDNQKEGAMGKMKDKAIDRANEELTKALAQARSEGYNQHVEVMKKKLPCGHLVGMMADGINCFACEVEKRNTPREAAYQKGREDGMKEERERCARIAEQKFEMSIPDECPGDISGCDVNHLRSVKRHGDWRTIAEAIRSSGKGES